MADHSPWIPSSSTSLASLPDDSLLTIFHTLHLTDLLALRCVCRRFNTLLSSPPFLATLPPAKPCFLLLPNLRPARAFDPTLDKFLHLPPLPPADGPVRPLSSSGGLLCLGSASGLSVGNPITCGWRKLPDAPLPLDFGVDPQSFRSYYAQASGLAVDKLAGTYQVMLIDTSSESGSARAFLYSSSTRSWSAGAEPPTIDRGRLLSAAVFACNQRFYSVWEIRGFMSILCYSGGCWTEIEAPQCSSSIYNCYLFERRGNLVMVGAVGAIWLADGRYETPTSFRIWELETEKKEWTEVARMPPELLRGFRRTINYERLGCVGKDDLIYIASPGNDVLMYDFSTSVWRWLPRVLPSVVSFAFLVFEPSLTATA